jgi:hypothetical protein
MGKADMRERIKTLMDYAFDRQYMTARAVRLAKLSMPINAAIALGKIGVGVYSLSLFVCVSGFYNIGIGLAKHIMVKGHSEKEQRRHYERVGWVMSASSVTYLIYCAHLAVSGEANVEYDLITSLAIATFTFTEIGFAVYGVLAVRKTKDLTLAAAKRINLVTALISIVLTESALLGMSEVENAARYCGWTGLIFGAVSAAIGLLMIIEVRRRKSKQLSNEQSESAESET